MKRSDEIRRKIREKEQEKEGWARDYRTQTSRLRNEIEWLYGELEEFQEMRKPDYEVLVRREYEKK